MKIFSIVSHAALLAAFCALPVQAQTPGGQVHVYLLSSKAKTELSIGQPATSGKAEQPGGLSMLIPIMPSSVKVHAQFGVQGAHASVVTSGSPVFEMDIAGYGNVDPAHFTPAIIRLHVDGNRRLIGTQLTTTQVRSGVTTLDPISDDRVAAKVENLGSGRYRIAPVQPLAPGEYAVAMRDPDVRPVTYTSATAASVSVSKQQIYQGWARGFSVSGASQ